jgi:hypothetical protein
MVGRSPTSNYQSSIIESESSIKKVDVHGWRVLRPHPIEPPTPSEVTPAFTSHLKRKHTPEDGETVAHTEVRQYEAHALGVVAH